MLNDYVMICAIGINKYLIKTTIYVKICITPHINPRPISALGLISESRVDIGCDTDFDMHLNLFISPFCLSFTLVAESLQ